MDVSLIKGLAELVSWIFGSFPMHRHFCWQLLTCGWKTGLHWLAKNSVSRKCSAPSPLFLIIPFWNHETIEIKRYLKKKKLEMNLFVYNWKDEIEMLKHAYLWPHASNGSVRRPCTSGTESASADGIQWLTSVAVTAVRDGWLPLRRTHGRDRQE